MWLSTQAISTGIIDFKILFCYSVTSIILQNPLKSESFFIPLQLMYCIVHVNTGRYTKTVVGYLISIVVTSYIEELMQNKGTKGMVGGSRARG